MELEEFKQKFNLPRINEYVATLSEEQINWFWQLLWDVKQVFPDIDIYHAGASKYGYLGFGRKRVQAKRVEDFLFVLHLEKNEEFILNITNQTYRLIPVDVLSQGYDESTQKELNLRDWLDQVKKLTKELDSEYSGEGLFPVDYEVGDYFTTLEAYDFLNRKYKKIKEETKKIVGFRNKSNREMALILENSRPSLFIGIDPEYNNLFKFKFIDNNSKIYGKYDKDEGRHDGLKSNAPSLYKGNEAFYIEINSLEDLDGFCKWYELDANKMSLLSELVHVEKKNENVMSQPLNRILFGAAGTGKTYNTINHALSIIENKSLDELKSEKRDELKERFDNYKEKGLIKFVTFHQSFSYEDFVEGIRAESDEDGSLNYLVKDGIFKEICGVTLSNQFSNLIGSEFGRGYVLQSINSDSLIVKKPNGNLIHLSLDLALLLLEKVVKNEITVEDINQKLAIEKLEANPLLEPYIINGYCTVWANLIQLMLDNREPRNLERSPCVLIIDEINRGNISRIFGELITLIEESKRAGADEELSVTLPYSKQEFTVPQNVYIIGTMNSSDRSLTGLDIALRRRFTFIEMPPRPELLNNVSVEGVDIEKLFTVINQRIEVLIDRDHCLGHANFMSLKHHPTIANLSNIFEQKVIPQLQEYFFDDWSKINMVLNNNGMLKAKSQLKTSVFPNLNTGDLEYFEEKKTWELVPNSFNLIESFAKIIQH